MDGAYEYVKSESRFLVRWFPSKWLSLGFEPSGYQKAIAIVRRMWG